MTVLVLGASEEALEKTMLTQSFFVWDLNGRIRCKAGCVLT